MPTVEQRVFLRCAWRGCASSLWMILMICAFPDSRAGVVTLVRSSRRDRARLVGAGAAFFLNFSGFNYSLSHT